MCEGSQRRGVRVTCTTKVRLASQRPAQGDADVYCCPPVPTDVIHICVWPGLSERGHKEMETLTMRRGLECTGMLMSTDVCRCLLITVCNAQGPGVHGDADVY